MPCAECIPKRTKNVVWYTEKLQLYMPKFIEYDLNPTNFLLSVFNRTMNTSLTTPMWKVRTSWRTRKQFTSLKNPVKFHATNCDIVCRVTNPTGCYTNLPRYCLSSNLCQVCCLTHQHCFYFPLRLNKSINSSFLCNRVQNTPDDYNTSILAQDTWDTKGNWAEVNSGKWCYNIPD